MRKVLILWAIIVIILALLWPLSPKIKGNAESMIAHEPGCPSYSLIKMHSNDKWFYTMEDAKEAGFRQANNCKKL